MRFTQQDTYAGTMNDSMSLNYYLYCCGNPVGFVDPNGRVNITTNLFRSIPISTVLPVNEKLNESNKEAALNCSKHPFKTGVSSMKMILGGIEMFAGPAGIVLRGKLAMSLAEKAVVGVDMRITRRIKDNIKKQIVIYGIICIITGIIVQIRLPISLRKMLLFTSTNLLILLTINIVWCLFHNAIREYRDEYKHSSSMGKIVLILVTFIYLMVVTGPQILEILLK